MYYPNKIILSSLVLFILILIPSLDLAFGPVSSLTVIKNVVNDDSGTNVPAVLQLQENPLHVQLLIMMYQLFAIHQKREIGF